jgi:phosphoribosyl 1,2-cyclic phosphate phosphodiesterase
MKLTILGCGTSAGVPMIGNRWGACNPENPKNRRTRTSALVAWEGHHILIDSSPDLRYQLLSTGIDDVDAVLYTHAHADHTHGLNDLCLLSRRKNAAIPIYGDKETLDALMTSFEYAFKDPGNDHYKPFLVSNEIRTNVPFSLFGQEVEPFPQDHGIIQSVGFKIGEIAYSTDVRLMNKKVLDWLKASALKVWVVDCLQLEPHRTHSHLAQTLKWIRHVKPERAILTHLSPHLDYDALSAMLPPNVVPAYDGMTVLV